MSTCHLGNLEATLGAVRNAGARDTEAVLEKVVVLQSCCALECCPGRGWGENRQKGFGAVSKDTVLVDSACVQAASYKLTN